MPAEMTDADDRDSQRHGSATKARRHEARFGHGVSGCRGRTNDILQSSCFRVLVAAPRPTIEMPVSSAAFTIASPSIISVLPASTDRTVAPALLIASIVDT